MVKQSPPKWSWDSREKRWRHGGRWASPPNESQLRVSRGGFLIDGGGKRVPKTAPVLIQGELVRLAKIVKKLSKPKKSKPKPPRQETRKIAQLALGTPFIDGVMNSSNWNQKVPENLSNIFEKILESASKRSAFEMNDILVYQHGIKFLGASKFTEEMKIHLAKIAKASGLSFKYAETRVGTELYVFMGKEMKLVDDVVRKLEKKEGILQKIYDTLIDYWGQLDWWYWFETEEALYE